MPRNSSSWFSYFLLHFFYSLYFYLLEPLLHFSFNFYYHHLTVWYVFLLLPFVVVIFDGVVVVAVLENSVRIRNVFGVDVVVVVSDGGSDGVPCGCINVCACVLCELCEYRTNVYVHACACTCVCVCARLFSYRCVLTVCVRVWICVRLLLCVCKCVCVFIRMRYSSKT